MAVYLNSHWSWACMINCIMQKTMDVISYSYHNPSQTMSMKDAYGCFKLEISCLMVSWYNDAVLKQSRKCHYKDETAMRCLNIVMEISTHGKLYFYWKMTQLGRVNKTLYNSMLHSNVSFMNDSVITHVRYFLNCILPCMLNQGLQYNPGEWYY